MESRQLFEKYKKGKHWEYHPTSYSIEFAKFLNKKNVRGLVVDAGCGNGRDTEIFNKKRLKVIGIDNSQEEISKNKKTHPTLTFEVQNIENMNFNNNSIAAFFCVNVIHYVNIPKAFSEFFRCLNKKGYLFIHFNIEIRDKNSVVDYCHSEEEIMQLVSDFTITKKRHFIRKDSLPIPHTHKILELILQKP